MANDIAGGWIDVSVPLHTGMVHWPDNPAVSIERMMSMDRGDTANVSNISMGAHTGTHMDAPIHFVQGGEGIDMLPLDAVIGAARVISIGDAVAISRAELEPYDIQRGERILFKTRNSNRVWSTDGFVEDFVYISAEAAGYLADRGVRTVGVDYLSVGGYTKDGPESHHALLGAGVWIIEGLNLASVEPGNYELVCLPLKIVGGDGAPARAIVRAVGG